MQNPLRHRVAKSIIWNTLGTSIFYISRFLISIFVVRMSSDYVNIGILTIAISISGIWNVIALFSVRNIQVSDVNNDFTSNEYITSRVVTVLLALIICVIHAVVFTGDVYKTLVVFAYMLFMVSMSYADVMYGILQKNWRMDLIGISHILKCAVFLTTFLLLFYYFDLLSAVVGLALTTIAIVFTFDTKAAQKYANIRIIINFRRIYLLLKLCFPLVVVSLFSTLIPSVTRLVLERLTDLETLGIYGSVTLPAAAIQILLTSIFAPFVNVFAQHFYEKNYKGFLRVYIMGIAVISAVFLMFRSLMFPFGDWLIGLVFGAGMVPYTYLFEEAILYCFLVCLCLFIMIPLIVLRYLKTIMVIYSIGIAVCLCLLNTMIINFGASGANYIQIISYAVIFVVSFIANIVIFKNAFSPVSH